MLDLAGHMQALEVLNPDIKSSPALPPPVPAGMATTATGAPQHDVNAGALLGSSQAAVKYVSVKLQQLQEGHLSPAQAAAVAHGGAKGLQQQLEDEHEASLPEFLRKRPKVRANREGPGGRREGTGWRRGSQAGGGSRPGGREGARRFEMGLGVAAMRKRWQGYT